MKNHKTGSWKKIKCWYCFYIMFGFLPAARLQGSMLGKFLESKLMLAKLMRAAP
jgi:hypothetical protein